MNLKEMRTIVQEELDHIPEGQQPQNMLRMTYWLRRMNSLGKKSQGPKDAFGVLQICLAEMKKDYPNFGFHFGRPFFDKRKADDDYFECAIISKKLDEYPEAVRNVGVRLLDLWIQEKGTRIGRIRFEGVPWDESSRALIGMCNSTPEHSRTAYIRFDRSLTRKQLLRLLREFFPQEIVHDVTLDGDSIYSSKK